MTVRVAWLAIFLFVALTLWLLVGAVVTVASRVDCPDSFTRECAVPFEEDE